MPGAESFYVVFDAGSNTTAGAGKVSLLRPEERDPVTFSARFVLYHRAQKLSYVLQSVNRES